MRVTSLRVVVAVAVLVGCGVPKEQLDAKAVEAANYKRQYQDESGKAEALEAKLAQVEEELESVKKARAELESALATSDERAQEAQRQVEALNALNQQLAESKQSLEKAKAELEKKSSEYESLASSLKDEIKSGKIELSELKGRMVVKMKDKILFSSGSVKIGAEGQDALSKVADALKATEGKLIRVEGHTDNVPTDPKGPFPSNWELSTTRALAVVHLLEERGVPAAKLSAAGYGEHFPIATNGSPEGRSLNRRIEIVLAPAEQAPSKAFKAAKR